MAISFRSTTETRGYAALLCLLVLALGTSVMPCVAYAQTAEELVTEAVAARRRSDDVAALGLLRRAVALERNGRTVGQLALVEGALGMWLEAERDLEESRALGGTWVQQSAGLSVLAQRIRENVGRLMVICETPGAVLNVNGDDHNLPLRSPLHLRTGRVELEVRAPGFRTVSRTLEIAPLREGASVGAVETFVLARTPVVAATVEPAAPIVVPPTQRITPNEPPRAARNPEPEPGSNADSFFAIGGVSLGLGIAGLVLGGVGHALYEDRVRSFNISTESGGCRDAPSTCEEWRSQWVLFDAVRTAGYVTGGILSLTGIAFFIAGATSGPTRPARVQNDDDEASSAQAQLRVACGPFADLGVACEGSF